jgi:hypothetical protein
MIRDEVKAMVYSRRLAILLFVAAVLLAALTPAACLLFVLLIAPLWFFCAATVSVPQRVFDGQIHKPQALAFPVFSPRPPPAL